MNVQFCCLADRLSEVQSFVPTLLQYKPRLASIPHAVSQAQVVLDGEAEATVMALLSAGARRVFVGEAALQDGSLVPRLLRRYGSTQIGLHVPVRRQSVNWTFDAESNADFSVVTPSLCEPAWELLKANAEPSGILAKKWIEKMLENGVESVLLRVDMADDADLNLCADMVEMFGSKLWLAPLSDPAPKIADWIRYGQVTQIALPSALYHRRHELLRPIDDVPPRELPHSAMA